MYTNLILSAPRVSGIGSGYHGACYFACKRILPLNGLEGQIFKAAFYVGISITETRLKSYQEGMIFN